MKKKLYFKKVSQIFGLCLLVIASNLAKAQKYELTYAKTFTSANGVFGACSVTDKAGNIYVGGEFWGDVDFNPGSGTFTLSSKGIVDAFIYKLDVYGNFLWAISFGSTFQDGVESISLDDDGNIYAAGTFRQTVDFDPGFGVKELKANGLDSYLLKLDKDGKYVFAKQLGISYDTKMVMDANMNIYIGGSFTGSCDFNPSAAVFNMTSKGGADVCLTKLSPAGNMLWARQFGGTDEDRLSALTVDVSGNVIISGTFDGTADFNPGVAVNNLVSTDGSQLFVCKVSTDGNFVWAEKITEPNYKNLSAIIADHSGNLYLGGVFNSNLKFDFGGNPTIIKSNGNDDAFIAKLESTGKLIWAKSFGGKFNDALGFLNLHTDGYLYFSSLINGAVDMDPGPDSAIYLDSKIGSSACISKFDTSGNYINSFGFNGPDAKYISGLTLDTADNMFVTLNFKGTIDVDPNAEASELTAAGGYDMVLVKLTPAKPKLGVKNVSFSPTIFPNPTNSFVNLNLGSEHQNVTVQVYNNLGQLQSQELLTSSSTIEIVLPNPAGTYFIQITLETGERAYFKISKI